jgi:hypothetical protein
MDLFELFIKIGADDQASSKVEKLTGKLKSGLVTAAKVGTAAVAAAATAITSLAVASVKQYSEYEQLVGGIDTLFAKSSKKVQGYASEAFKTAQISANDYMSLTTSFAASLLQSLEGDTDAAADAANRAVIDMADNANKMGTSMESIQNAYQGFAKQNYTMLDNLKLGYGGTKSEMRRLIKDANAVKKANGEMANLSIKSFADIVEAIHIVQSEMGITGTSAQEASKTITGSFNSTKAAWENLLAGMANDEADFEKLTNDFVESLVGKNGEGGLVNNILPRVKTALGSASDILNKVLPDLSEELPKFIEDLAPDLVNGILAVTDAVNKSLEGAKGKTLVDKVMTALNTLVTGLFERTDDTTMIALNLIVAILEGLPNVISSAVPALVTAIVSLLEQASEPQFVGDLNQAAIGLASTLLITLSDVSWAGSLIVNLVENLILTLLNPSNMFTLVDVLAGVIKAYITFAFSIIEAWIDIGSAIKKLFTGEIGLEDIGRDIVDGIWKGVEDRWGEFSSWFAEKWNGLVGSTLDLLGIHSPSRVFADIGKNTILGYEQGVDKTFPRVSKNVTGRFSQLASDIEGDISASVMYHPGSQDHSTKGPGVSIVQNIYSEAKTAADLMREAQYEAERAVLLGV